MASANKVPISDYSLDNVNEKKNGDHKFTSETIDINNGIHATHLDSMEKDGFQIQPKPNALCILAICVVMSGTLMFGADTTLFGAIQSVDSFVEKFCP
eukprot:Pgem_evm1s15299